MDDHASHSNSVKKKTKKTTTLLQWMNCLNVGEELKSMSQLCDGRHFSSLMRLLNDTPVQNKLKVTSWQRTIKTYLEGYYQASLKDTINFDTASKGNEEELSKICTYMLCATFNDANGAQLANRLTTLDTCIQEGIKLIIECILQDDTPLQKKLSSSLLNVARAFNAVPPSEPKGGATVSGSNSPIGQMLQSPITINRSVIREKTECINKLKKQLQEENVARTYYENEAQEFKTLSEKNENFLEVLKNDYKHLKTKFEQLEFEKQQLQSEIDQKDTRMKRMEAELLRFKEESAEHESRNRLFIETEKENLELKTKFERLEDAYNKSKRGNELLDQLEAANEELKQKLTHKMDQITHYKHRLEEAESDMKKMRELELERRACKSPEEVPEVGERLSTIIEVELWSSREHVALLQAALETKNEELEQLTKDYESNLHAVNESKAILEQRIDEELNAMNDLRAKTEADLKDKNTVIETLQRDVEQAVTTAERHLLDKNRLQMDLIESKNNVNSLVEELSRIRDACLDHEKTNLNLVEELKAKESNWCAVMEEAEANLNDVKSEFTRQIAELNEAKLGLADENRNQTVINEHLNSHLNEVEQELLNVNSKLRDEHERLKTVSSELEKVTAVCEMQINVLNRFTTTVEGLTADVDRVDHLHSEKLQTVERRFDNLQRMFQSLECQLQKRRQEQLQIKSDLEEQISNLNESCMRLENENAALINLGRENDLRCRLKEKVCEKLKLKLQRHIDDLIEERCSLQNEISSEKEVINGLNDRLNKVIIERDEELSARRDVDKKLENLLPKLEELENARCQVQLLNETVNCRSSELEVVKMKLDEMTRMSEMQSVSYQDELMKYEEKLAEKDEILKHRLEELQQVSKQMDVYKSQSDADNVWHKEQLQKFKNIQENLEESIKSFREENKKLSHLELTVKNLDEQLKLTKSELDQERSVRIAAVESYHASVTNCEVIKNQTKMLEETVTSLSYEKAVVEMKLNEITKANEIQLAAHQYVLKKCDEDLQQAVSQAEIYRCRIDTDNAVHEEQLHKYQNSLEILEQSVKSLKEENEKLSHIELMVRSLDEQLTLTKTELDQQKSITIAVEERYQASVTNCEVLKNQMRLLEETVTSLASEKDILVTKLAETAKANEMQLSAHQHILNKCEEDLQQAVSQAEIYRCQIDSDKAVHDEQLHKYLNSLEVLEQSVKSLKEENEKLSGVESTVKNLDQQLNLTKAELDQEKSTRIAVEERYQASVTNCEMLKNQMRLLEETATSLASKKDILVTKLAETAKENEMQLLSHQHVLNKCEEDLQQAVKQAEVYRCQIDSDKAVHEEQLHKYQNSLAILEQSVKSLKEENEKLSGVESTVKNLEQQLNLTKTEFDQEKCTRIAVEERYQASVTNCEVLTDQMRLLEESVTSLTSEKDILITKLAETAKANEMQLAAHQQVLNKCEEDLQQAVNQTEFYRRQIDSDRAGHRLQEDLDGLKKTIDHLKEECQSKGAEIAEWKQKYNVLMKRNISDTCKLQDEYERKQLEADSNGRAVHDLKEEILKLREQVVVGERKHQKAVDILTKVNEELKDDCRRRRSADETYRAEIQAKDGIIQHLRQQLRSKAPAAEPDRRDTFVLLHQQSSAELDRRETFVLPKTTAKSAALGSARQLAVDDTHSCSVDQNMHLFKHATVDLGSTIASARGWVSCEDEEGEFHNVSYLQDLKTPKDDIGRLDELQRRNTLCLPHLRTSYPLETIKARVDFKDEDLKSGNIKFSLLQPTTRQNIADLQMDDLSDRRKTRVIQPSYHKPGPPTPGRTTRHPDSLQSKLQRTPNSVKNIFKRPSITPKSYAKYRVQTPKRHNENNPPPTYTQASPRAAVKKATAFSIGFSPKVKKSRPAVKKDSKVTSTPMPKHGQN